MTHRFEMPEHRARSTYELLIGGPFRPGALKTLTEAFRQAENDALERAAEACLGVPVRKEAHLEGIYDDDKMLIGTVRRGPSTSLPRAEAYAAAIRFLKHKEPS